MDATAYRKLPTVPRRHPRRVATPLWITLANPLLLTGCGSGVNGMFASPGGPTTPLSADDVTLVITQAASALSNDTLIIAVTDREGLPLGLFRKPQAPQQVTVRLAGVNRVVDANELAIALARTGAYFSNDQAPLSSRTVRFISREHFPATFAPDGRVTGVKNTPSGALWDIEHTNRGCPLSSAFIPGQQITPARTADRSGPGLGIATVPGGVPLYKNGKLVGGVGVTGVAPQAAEFAALTGSTGFGPVVAPPGEIFIDGVRLPFVEQDQRPVGSLPGEPDGAYVSLPDVNDPAVTSAEPQASPRPNVPEGWLVGPRDGTQLSARQVRGIIERAVFQANKTRAAIRLPLQVRTKMVIAVSDLDGQVLGLFRMNDATVFSIDVAVTKARNVVYFSGFSRRAGDLPGVPLGTAITNRTLRFASQPFFPPGINDSLPGPFTNLRLRNAENPCTQGLQEPGPNQSGIVFFPGSAPLYRFGLVLAGGLGVSGDGVDQDDFVTAAGIVGYEAAPFLRADRVSVGGVTLPYLKFPRAPEE